MATPATFRGSADRALAQQVMNHLRTVAGQPVEVVIRKPRTKRSLDQNAFWWSDTGPVKLLAEHCGHTDSQMHYALLGECFGYASGPNGQAVPVKASSAELSVDEFRRLIDWVLIWAPSEMGVSVPSPEEWQLAQVA